MAKVSKVLVLASKARPVLKVLQVLPVPTLVSKASALPFRVRLVHRVLPDELAETVSKVRGPLPKVPRVLKVLRASPAWPLVIKVFALRSKVRPVLRVLRVK